MRRIGTGLREPRRRMTRLASGFALLSLVFGSFTLFLPPARADGVVKATYGDWETRCDTPTGAKGEQCALVQNVVAEDRPNITLVVIVLKPVDKKKPLMRVVAPPFVFLPTGLGLKIDQVDVGHVPFAHCFGSGCFSEVEMDDKLIGQLKNGTTATFIVFQSPDDGVGIPVSLNGFAKGFDALP